jgi:hypothetical protein
MIDKKTYMTIEEVGIGSRADTVFIEVLRRLKQFNFVLLWGTALGLYRDGELIPEDTDIDIAFPIFNGAENIIKSIFSDYPLAIEKHLNNDVQQLVYYPNDVIIDLCFFYPNGEMYEYLDGLFTIKNKFIEDVTMHKTRQFGAVPIPTDIEDYLVETYGDDWHIPQHKKGKRNYEKS